MLSNILFEFAGTNIEGRTESSRTHRAGIWQGYGGTCPGHWISRYATKLPILCWCATATWSHPLTDFIHNYHPELRHCAKVYFPLDFCPRPCLDTFLLETAMPASWTLFVSPRAEMSSCVQRRTMLKCGTNFMREFWRCMQPDVVYCLVSFV